MKVSVRPVAAHGEEVSKAGMFGQLQALIRNSDEQRFNQIEAENLTIAVGTSRLVIHEQSHSATPVALLVVMVAWLAVLFLGSGAFAQVNGTVIISMFFGALSEKIGRRVLKM